MLEPRRDASASRGSSIDSVSRHRAPSETSRSGTKALQAPGVYTIPSEHVDKIVSRPTSRQSSVNTVVRPGHIPRAELKTVHTYTGANGNLTVQYVLRND